MRQRFSSSSHFNFWIIAAASNIAFFLTSTSLFVDSFPLSATINNIPRREAIHNLRSILHASKSADMNTRPNASTIMRSTNNNHPKDTNTVRWGIVGLGDVCQQKSGPAFYKCQNSQLNAVMRRTPGKAQAFADQVPVPESGSGEKCVGYESLEEFLKHPHLDAVYVSTRPGSHLEIVRQIAGAKESGTINLEACYVEKPVGRCAAEAEEMQSLLNEQGIEFYTAFISRAYDRTQSVLTLIREGCIGDITGISYDLIGTGGARDMQGDVPWRLDAVQSGGGLIMDVGCHVLDRIEYYGGGPLTHVSGYAKNRNSPMVSVEDCVHLTAEIEIGGVGEEKGKIDVECTWDFAPPKDTLPKDALRIVGAKGSLLMAGMSPNGTVQLLDGKGGLRKEYAFDMPQHTAQGLVQEVTNDILRIRKLNGNDNVNSEKGEEMDLEQQRRHSRSSILADGGNGIRTQRVIDAALDSYYGGRESGFWTRDDWPGKPKPRESQQQAT